MMTPGTEGFRNLEYPVRIKASTSSGYFAVRVFPMTEPYEWPTYATFENFLPPMSPCKVVSVVMRDT